MGSLARSTFEARYDQMFPTLNAAEIGRLRRFGEQRTYARGEQLVTTGDVSPGMFVIVSGEVAVSQHSLLGRDQPIVTHGPGSFMGELAQLSGQPALVDARATKPAEAYVIPSRRLRDVLVAEAELGDARPADSSSLPNFRQPCKREWLESTRREPGPADALSPGSCSH